MGYKDSALYQDLTPTLAAVALFSSLGAYTFGRNFGSGTKIVDGAVVRALSSSDKSTGTALGTAGIMVGCALTPFVNERYGRRKTFVLLGVIGIIGTIIQACSTINHSYWTLVGGKVVVNISVGIASAVTGVYQAECAPRRIRGALVNCYTVVQNFGTLLANLVMFLVHARKDSGVWMVPIAVQFVFPVIIAAGSMFLPESPRWCVSKGRHDEAMRSLRRLRGAAAPQADLDKELNEISAAYEEQAKSKSIGWAQLFRGTDRRRTLIAIGMQCLQQGQGISFMNNYLNITMLALGFTNAYELLVVLYSCKVIISFLGFYLPDRVGRRPLVLFGSSMMLTAMAIVGAVAAATGGKPTGALGRLTLGAIFTWILVYSFTWSPMPWTIASEVSSNSLREKTLATAAWSGFGVGLISNLVVPYIQDQGKGGLGGRIAFIWMGFSVFAIIFCAFFVPEFKGRSLEELDILFDNRVPAHRFNSYKIADVMAPVVAEGEKNGGKATELKLENARF